MDVGRALAEENRPDALGLATELIATAEVAAQRLGTVSGWEPATALVNRMISLMDIGVRAGRQYRRYLADDEPAGLGRANELITEMRPVVDETTARLSDLAREGLSCPGHELTIESP